MPLAYVTQTTLSVDDTAEVIAALQKKFPQVQAPRKEDICYATTNRQSAVKEMAARCQLMLVVGASNSSNSNRLVEAARRYGADDACLVPDQSQVPWGDVDRIETLGITAGASAPEYLVQDIIAAARARYDSVSIEDITTAREDITFKLPRILSA